MPLGSVVSPFSTTADLAALAGRPSPLRCRPVTTAEELLIHLRIREVVFVHEQGLFQGSDRDALDDDPATLHVLGLKGPVAGGTVRLYPLQERGQWKGDRLAVLPPFRASGLGAELVRFAVRTAARQGGTTMIAYVQIPNVRFFEFLGWERVGEPVEYVGQLHQKMAIDLRRRRRGRG
ncbi:MAG TPA: MSMEG_0567/Sll0786 family nitrogen starvation N-acetyltransferase [Candidatus Dormibacteraeota bacterium]|nr:MSMEG_0567/Sll0786 family nitrogen starvation N-acetyltransferase [Candidatus Dormibacteraeota bacterium]